MKILAAVLLFAAGAARAADLAPLKACVKWSREIPEAQAAAAGRFASVTRVEGAAPYAGCEVVTVTETFGVGWLMRAWMKQAVFNACGERLGGYKVNYKGEEWQGKIVVALHDFLSKNPEALAKIRTCVPPVVQAPLPVVAPVVQSTAIPAAVQSSTETAPK